MPFVFCVRSCPARLSGARRGRRRCFGAPGCVVGEGREDRSWAVLDERRAVDVHVFVCFSFRRAFGVRACVMGGVCFLKPQAVRRPAGGEKEAHLVPSSRLRRRRERDSRSSRSRRSRRALCEGKKCRLPSAAFGCAGRRASERRVCWRPFAEKLAGGAVKLEIFLTLVGNISHRRATTEWLQLSASAIVGSPPQQIEVSVHQESAILELFIYLARQVGPGRATMLNFGRG